MTLNPPTPVPQPFLHELVSCVRAPAVALSNTDGQIRAGGVQGLFLDDFRVVSELVVDLDGAQPVPVGHSEPDAATAQFVSVVRHLGDPTADPTVRLERERRLTGDQLTERLTLVNASRQPVATTVGIDAAVDFAAMGAVKHGEPTTPLPPQAVHPGAASWAGGPDRTATLSVTGEPTLTIQDRRLRVNWRVSVPPRQRWVAVLTVTATGPGDHATPGALTTTVTATTPTTATPTTPAAIVTPATIFIPASAGPGWLPVALTGRPELVRLVERGVADLSSLMLADPRRPADLFVAAGSPWFLTLFGRDSLWAARLTLPLGTELAAGTLRTLARRQGKRHDPETAEAPGKILHEVRSGPAAVGSLPPVYFGTVDATALWVCLLHDAWRWGMPAVEIAELLEPLAAALGWLLTDADPDDDGFLEYLDVTGRGLVNQGWKDSVDSIQFPDGTIAEPPIALSEAQAYAYQAATCGAELLAEFRQPGAPELRIWAGRLKDRFRQRFWVHDDRGRYPAIALASHKQPVPTAASNLGHLLGTGLLEPAEAAAVAARLGQPDLDCGYGLRTMSADAAGFNPLGYHSGSVWPHDTAIAVRGLAAEGHHRLAASLAGGLLRAAGAFGYRLPELFAGTDARTGEPVLAYPAACRPQAWAAAAAVALLPAALGLAVDLPRKRLRVQPPADFAHWFPLRISGLRLAGHPLSIAVDAERRVEVETTAPVTVLLGDNGVV
jgi:glycogen debranching enzyme